MDQAREIFVRHHAHYEVSPYYTVLDVRTPGAAPRPKSIQAGFDVDVFGREPGLSSPVASRRKRWPNSPALDAQLSNKRPNPPRSRSSPAIGALVLVPSLVLYQEIQNV
ncbi:MAG: hypothetical protein ACLQU1_30305 [Bryobacteraceae bacterium]